MLPDTWPLWAQIITGIGLLCGALLGIAAFLVKTGRGMKTAANWVRGVVFDAITDVVKEHTLSPDQVGGLVTEVVRQHTLTPDQVSQLVTDVVDAKLAPIGAELRRNGGMSIKDQVTRIDTRLREHITNETRDRVELWSRLEALDPGRFSRSPDPSPPDGELSP